MLIGVCDFPGDYAFPPYGYGGIERWLWAVAIGARQAGADVHLLGHLWRGELAQEWPIRPIRLEDVTLGGQQARSLHDDGYDLLVVGHEYPSLPTWRSVSQTPASRGPGSAIHRLLEEAVTQHGNLGMSRLVRWSHSYWSLFAPLPVPWPEVCRIVDTQVVRRRSTRAR